MPTETRTETKDRLTFDAKAHKYAINGRPVPSVTEIIAENGLYDPRHYPEDARRRGTFVHQASVLLDEKDLHWPSVPEEWAGYLRSWEAFKARMGVLIIETERRVFDPLYGVAGTLDRVMTFGTGTAIWVIDLKTVGDGKGAAPFWTRYQTAAYEAMYRRETGALMLRRGALVLRADGSLPRLTEYDDDGDWSAFLALCEATKIRRRHHRERANDD